MWYIGHMARKRWENADLWQEMWQSLRDTCKPRGPVYLVLEASW